MEPGMPGSMMSEKGTRQLTVDVTVAGVPTGTPKAAVLIAAPWLAQTRPLLERDAATADCPSAVACSAVLAKDAALAEACAASTTAVRANQTRPPAMRRPRKITRAGTSKVNSTAAAPRSSKRCGRGITADSLVRRESRRPRSGIQVPSQGCLSLNSRRDRGGASMDRHAYLLQAARLGNAGCYGSGVRCSPVTASGDVRCSRGCP